MKVGWRLWRLLNISYVLIKNGLDEVILATHLFRPLRFCRYLLPWLWLRRLDASRAVRLRRTLEDLGPLFVKFGQILSTRRDLLPDDIAEELSLLQDRVRPFPGQEARRLVEQAYKGRSVYEVFLEFDETPLASASIAQVHAATLLDGKKVIVKVVRPNIEKIIRRDVQLLYVLAEMVERYWPDGRRLHSMEVVQELEKTILDELDLLREAANASQLQRNFLNSPLLYVPTVYWDLCRKQVLVMERIYGTPISDIERLQSHNVDLKQLAERGVEIFFTQVFKHRYFHADMHPGNIFVSDQGQYIAVDFGIMGSLAPEDQYYLAENFLAFFNRDYRRVAVLHVESGWVPENTRVDELEAAIRTVCEPIFQRPLKEISFGHLLIRLFQTARRFNMHVQPQLVLLQKTLLNIEGLGRRLYPDLDLWQTAKPFLEQWASERFGVKALWQEISVYGPKMLYQLPQIPRLLHEVLKQSRDGKLKIEGHSEQLQQLRRSLLRSHRQLGVIIVAAACLLGGLVVLGLETFGLKSFNGVPILVWLLLAVGAGLIISIWLRPSVDD